MKEKTLDIVHEIMEPMVSTNHDTPTEQQGSDETKTIISKHHPVVRTAALLPIDKLWDHKMWHVSIGECCIRKRRNCIHPQIELYTTWCDPLCQITWIVLEECIPSIKYKWIEINPYIVNVTAPGGYTKQPLPLSELKIQYPQFCSISPYGTLPAIQQHPTNATASSTTIQLYGSLVTAEYINKVYGNSSLIPSDPYVYALMQLWYHHIIERIEQPFYKTLQLYHKQQQQKQEGNIPHEEEVETESPVVPLDEPKNPDHYSYYSDLCVQGLRELIRGLQQTKTSSSSSEGGPYYLLGIQYTLLDVVLIPIYQRILWIGHHPTYTTPTKSKRLFRWSTHETEFIFLNTWWHTVMKRKAVATTFVCKERLIASYTTV